MTSGSGECRSAAVCVTTCGHPRRPRRYHLHPHSAARGGGAATASNTADDITATVTTPATAADTAADTTGK